MICEWQRRGDWGARSSGLGAGWRSILTHYERENLSSHVKGDSPLFLRGLRKKGQSPAAEPCGQDQAGI
jgi:hypothetical protein